VQAALRVLAAVIAGYVVAGLGATVGTAVGALMFPQSPDAIPTTPYLAVAIAFGFLASIAAGYLTARLAPAGRMLLTMALLILVLLGMSAVSARIYAEARQPAGYLPAVTMLAVIGVWAGAMLERAVRGRPRPGV
jgi:drug/metabolite transporter (DMT)-like permease